MSLRNETERIEPLRNGSTDLLGLEHELQAIGKVHSIIF